MSLNPHLQTLTDQLLVEMLENDVDEAVNALISLSGFILLNKLHHIDPKASGAPFLEHIDEAYDNPRYHRHINNLLRTPSLSRTELYEKVLSQIEMLKIDDEMLVLSELIGAYGRCVPIQSINSANFFRVLMVDGIVRWNQESPIEDQEHAIKNDWYYFWHYTWTGVPFLR